MSAQANYHDSWITRRSYDVFISTAKTIDKLTRWILLTGGVFCALAVVVGAFGAHALKPVLDEKAMGWIDTGVFYQFSHALALIACGLLTPGKANSRTALLFAFGIVLFSGSLYVMALTGITRLGMITPVGGVCFIAGWLSFCHMAWCLEEKQEIAR